MNIIDSLLRLLSVLWAFSCSAARNFSFGISSERVNEQAAGEMFDMHVYAEPVIKISISFLR